MMKYAVLVTLLLSLLMMATGGPAVQNGPTATPPPKQCRLVFEVISGDKNTPNKTHAIDPKTNIVTDTPIAEDMISPDGRYALRIIPMGVNRQMVLTLLVGLGNSRLIGPPSGDVMRAVWSPDSTRIAFIMIKDSVQSLYITGLTTAESVRLTDWNQRDDFPAWSSDGKMLYFVSATAKTTSIYKVSTEPIGKPEIVIPEVSGPFSISPDGKRIVYAAQVDGKPALKFSVPDATMMFTAPITEIAWSSSADQAQIAFVSGGRLYLLPVGENTTSATDTTISGVANIRWDCRDTWDSLPATPRSGPARR